MRTGSEPREISFVSPLSGCGGRHNRSLRRALSSGALTKNSPVRATTFYACEANSGGAVSTISALSSLQCKKGFTKVSWNATVDDVNFANANLLGDTNLALNGTDMFANTVCPDGSKSQEDQGTCLGHTKR